MEAQALALACPHSASGPIAVLCELEECRYAREEEPPDFFSEPQRSSPALCGPPLKWKEGEMLKQD